MISPDVATQRNGNGITLKKAFYALLHGLFLLFLSNLAFYIKYNLAWEESMVKSVKFAEQLVKPPVDVSRDFLFIDVSGCNTLVGRDDMSGNRAITDRKPLADFFTLLKSHKWNRHRSILCDVLFDIPTPEDSLLDGALNGLERVFIPDAKEENKILEPVIHNATVAYGGCSLSAGMYAAPSLVKYDYLPDDNMVSVPLAMVKEEHNSEAERRLGILWFNNKVYFNRTIWDERIRWQDISDERKGVRFYPLQEIMGLLTTDSLYNEIVAGKYVFIGDFEKDLHDTYAGRVPGTLVLANAFLNLKEDCNRITLSWLCFLLLGYTCISWALLYPPQKAKNILKWLEESYLGKWLADFLSFGLLLWILSFLSYHFFHKHADCVLVALYITFRLTEKSIRLKIKTKRNAAVSTVA